MENAGDNVMVSANRARRLARNSRPLANQELLFLNPQQQLFQQFNDMVEKIDRIENQMGNITKVQVHGNMAFNAGISIVSSK